MVESKDRSPRYGEALADPRGWAGVVAKRMREFGTYNVNTAPANTFADTFLMEATAVLDDPDREVLHRIPGSVGVAQTLLQQLVGPGDAAFYTRAAELPEGAINQITHPVFGVPGLFVQGTFFPPRGEEHQIRCAYDLVSKHHLPARRDYR